MVRRAKSIVLSSDLLKKLEEEHKQIIIKKLQDNSFNPKKDSFSRFIEEIIKAGMIFRGIDEKYYREIMEIYEKEKKRKKDITLQDIVNDILGKGLFAKRVIG